jgi:ethanolamine transporter EutH
VTPAIPASSYTQLHLRFGWWSLFLFGAFGLLLETFHGFKLAAYLDLANDTRRLMWTLAHAHGVGLALVHLLFAITVQLGLAGSTNHRFISRCLIAASVLLPGGFFAGGVVYYGGDPGLGILVVPLGAVFLLTAVLLLARATNQMDRNGRTPDRTRKM